MSRAPRFIVPRGRARPLPDDPSVIQRSNRATIERLGAIEVATLPSSRGPSRPRWPRPARRCGPHAGSELERRQLISGPSRPFQG